MTSPATGAVAPRSRLPWLLCLAGLALLLLTSGCALFMAPSPPPPSPRPAERSIDQRATAAWEAGDYSTSVYLYRQVLDQPGLSMEQRSRAWERMVLSALKNKQYNLALESMPKWRFEVPGAVESQAWQDAYFNALQHLGDAGVQETELLALSSDESLPWSMRARAGIVLATLHWGRGDVRRPQMILSLVQQQAQQRGQEALAAIENMLLQALASVNPQYLEAFEMLIPEEARTTFPYTVVQLEKARRLAANPGSRAQAYTLVQRVAPFLADRSLVKRVLSGESAPSAPGDYSVALALPLTGPYGEVASKVLRGAMAAQKDLAEQGTNVDVQVVNTDAGTWQQDLTNLPPQVKAVGGPLRVDLFKQLLNTQLPKQRAFFAFLASMGSANEGQDAWRFFTSAEDQVRTMVNAAGRDFNVFNTAVLYPEDSYGMHMAQLFRQEAMGQRLAVAASEGYSPSDTAGWSSVVARVAQSGAGAVFIPGDWDQVEQLAPYLAYNDAGGMLIMGPSLWGPSIDRKGYVEISSFGKAIFPGAWWPENDAPAAMALKRRLATEGQPTPDFWAALGYDFVRFATLLELPEAWTPAAVNQRIQYAQGMSWSQAPIAWDTQGRAAQQLFALRLTQHGYTLLTPGGDALTEPTPTSAPTPNPVPNLPQEQPLPYSAHQPQAQTQETHEPTPDQRYALPPPRPDYGSPSGTTPY